MADYNINAALRSSMHNECYLFVDERYVVVNYAPGFQKYQIVNGPIHSSDVFPIVYNIECAFDAENNEAFIFFGEECAKIYSGKATLLTGPIMVGAMFPCLKGTVFESGFDTAIRSTGKDVILFHEDNLVTIDYHFKRLRGPVKKIRDCFRCLVGTVFEKGINSGFASHITNEAYIFKGEYFARINIGSVAFGGTGDYFVNGRIELIRDEWPALHNILHYN